MASISIAVVSDTRDAVASVKNLSAGYSGLVEQLKQLGPDGAAAAQQLEDKMKAAQLATQDSGKAAKELVDQINRAKLVATQGGLDFSEPLKKSSTAAEETATRVSSLGSATSEAGEHVDDLATKKLENLKEGLSFNASYSIPSVVDALGQEGLAGAIGGAGDAISGMGMMLAPEFMVPLLAAGAVVTLVTSYFENQQKAAQEDQQAIANMTGDLVTEFVKAHQAGDDYGKALEDWAENADKYGISLTDLQKDVANGSIPFKDVAAAIVDQNIPAMKQYIATAKDQIAQDQNDIAWQNDLVNAYHGTADSRQQGTKATNDYIAAKTKLEESDKKDIAGNQDVVKALNDRIKSIEKAEADEKALAAAMGKTVPQLEDYEDAMQDGAKAQSQMASALGGVDDQMTDQEQAAGKLALSHAKLVDAQNAYNAAVKKSGATSTEAAKAQTSLMSAQDTYNTTLSKSSFNLQDYMDNLDATLDTNDRFVTETTDMIGKGLSKAGEDFVSSNQATTQAAWEAAAGSPAQQAALVTAWNHAGSQSAESFGEQIGQGIYKAMQDAQATAAASPINVKYNADTSALPKSFPPIPVEVRYLAVPSTGSVTLLGAKVNAPG